MNSRLQVLALIAAVAARGCVGVGAKSIRRRHRTRPNPFPGCRPTAASRGFREPGEIRKGWILGRTGNPREVTYQVHDGLAIREGDINLGPADRIPETRQELEALALSGQADAARGVVISGSAYRWPGGIVPCEIGTAPYPDTVMAAMAMIERSVAGVTFVPRSGHPNYVGVPVGCELPLSRRNARGRAVDRTRHRLQDGQCRPRDPSHTGAAPRTIAV